MSGLPGPAAWQARYAYDADGAVWRPRAERTPFGYTDGSDVEARLFEAVTRTTDRSVLSMPLRRHITDWPSRYHLSPVRANLLRPLAARFAGASVLEVGAGCGALTRFLGESGATVVALEGSVTRARIAAARCRDLPAVSVIADVFHDLPPAPEFDFVSLIGVLEYARIFFSAGEYADPVDAMLAHAARFLRPDGQLIVAIENQLGLKYFAGYREDHVSVPLYGIEDLYQPNGAVTFGRAELGRRIARAGLSAQRWLYPFPDYKLPTTIFTERGVAGLDGADLTPLLSASVVADPQVPPRFAFSLEQAWRVVGRNGLAGQLANSFLVLASASAGEPDDDAALAWHYSADRRPCFAKALEVRAAEGGVRVTARGLSNAPAPADAPLTMRLAGGPYLAGELWHTRLLVLLNRPGWTVADVASWASTWLDGLTRTAGAARPTLGPTTVLRGDLLDATPRNLLVRGADHDFIDLEWLARDGVRFGHLLYRSIMLSLLAAGSVARPAAPGLVRIADLYATVADAIGCPFARADLDQAHADERALQRWVNEADWIGIEAVRSYELTVRPADPA